ncbi:NAD(P)/FAD-dependent oxidoreductase [Jannaschia rubra]|uniref:Ferredoxin--NAD(P)(+) reductase fdr n=1 Tax=Jannaschia rubra TaxID=282197 RepID=A0A0M6XR23_9RHOB|nr:FAD-dependent oxidoreductase [Jannaschia rubra]CTQ32474.1 Ferredoxin--NAD(P)(+) reductase fdr [Jannaschia rubra]SFF83023.1 3-phenylpropionate/trans-cinnamate dioxygenase ferredoxin reductase subunit [Jannaschia rubra]
MDHIAVIGAGQAGATLVETLRKQGFDRRITLWGDEPLPPYQRPPLSKGYLLGEMARDRLLLRPASFYDDQRIELHTGSPVLSIDPAARTLTHGGGTMAWDALALTTGSRPRTLPATVGGTLGGVFTVRTLADIDAMAPAFREGAHLLVVGGGYIGLEAAAVARKRGLRVTLIESADRLLSRVSSPETARWFAEKHRAEGVTIRENATLERLTGTGRVDGAVLSDGTHLSVDAVVCGIGILPDVSLAQAAGLVIDDGIAVDGQGRTSAAGIWAAGDCCSFPWRGGRLRLESVPHAIDQAGVVARNILGAEETYEPRPWFWSDQYDVKLQIAGLNTGYDRVVVRDGDGRSHWYFHGDTLLAVDAMNDARAYMVGKRLIEAEQSPDPAAVADPQVPVKSLLPAA